MLLVAFSTCLFASQGIIRSSANLRPTPSAARKPLLKLAVADEIEILDETPQNGYYHVRAEDGTEGWVWSRAVRLVEEEKDSPVIYPARFRNIGNLGKADAEQDDLQRR